MIKERYCSYEVARLLEEKGFDEECGYYYEHGTDKPHEMTRDEIVESCNFCIKAPTHQMACDWLRKAYNIHIGINPISGKGYNATIYDVADFDDYGIIYSTESFFHVEEVYEAALKYSLENLV